MAVWDPMKPPPPVITTFNAAAMRRSDTRVSTLPRGALPSGARDEATANNWLVAHGSGDSVAVLGRGSCMSYAHSVVAFLGRGRQNPRSNPGRIRRGALS